MTTEIERRVGNLLDSSQSRAGVSGTSSETSAQRGKQASAGVITQPVSALEFDSTNGKFSLELKEKQDKMKVHIPLWLF